MLDLRQLTVLRAVAREGSLAAAARSLHYSQPTVTHHLSALESHLGVQLVQRTPRGATVTDLGELFLQHAEGVLDRLASAEAEVRGDEQLQVHRCATHERLAALRQVIDRLWESVGDEAMPSGDDLLQLLKTCPLLLQEGGLLLLLLLLLAQLCAQAPLSSPHLMASLGAG